jgi:hypothetical protein
MSIINNHMILHYMKINNINTENSVKINFQVRGVYPPQGLWKKLPPPLIYPSFPLSLQPLPSFTLPLSYPRWPLDGLGDHGTEPLVEKVSVF